MRTSSCCSPSAITVLTSNLAFGVIGGVISAMILFARRVAHFASVTAVTEQGRLRQRRRPGPHGRWRALLRHQQRPRLSVRLCRRPPDRIVIDLTNSHIWDASTVAAPDAIETKYARHGKQVEIVGLNESWATRHRRLSGQLGEGH